MTRLKLKYVMPIRKPDGRTYYYFRRRKSVTALPGLPGSAEFMDAYAECINELPPAIGASRTIAGTVNAAIVAYYQDYRFTKNRPISQQTDRNILEAFRGRHGDKRIALMDKRHIMAMLAEKGGKPAAQRNLLRVLRGLLEFCVEQNWLEDNPAHRVKLKPTRSKGFHSWSEDELRQYEDRWPIGSVERLAFALLLWTAQRRTDMVALGPANIVTRSGEQRLQFEQSKTGTRIDIPLAPPLAEIIA